jgi:hypothetical protein
MELNTPFKISDQVTMRKLESFYKIKMEFNLSDASVTLSKFEERLRYMHDECDNDKACIEIWDILWQRCNRVNKIMLFLKRKGISKRRNKRSSILRDWLGIMTDEDREVIQKNERKLDNNTIILKEELIEQKGITIKMLEDANNITKTTDQIGWDTFSMRRVTRTLQLLENEMIIFEDNIFKLYETLMTGKLFGGMLKIEDVESWLAKAKRNLRLDTEIIYKDALAMLINEGLLINLEKENISLTIKIPVVNKKRYEMYRLKKLPIVHGDIIAIVDLPEMDIVTVDGYKVRLKREEKCTMYEGEEICNLSGLPMVHLQTRETCFSKELDQNTLNMQGKNRSS